MAKSYGAAIVGAGWVSGEHIKAYQQNPHTHVVGAYSRRSESAKARLDEAGQDGRVYASLEEVLA
ncbi:MAG TPA: Gfo/Idh/MocA family oxidoreductase, partial [Limnochordia bacterium]|nr:Gfo/Idh/MocA family oxidoreductase [Limnochordia bacterium]